MTADLASWLLEQIAADEEAARECAKTYPPPWDLTDRGWVAYVKADAPDFREVARLEDRSPDVAGGDTWLGDRLAHVARWDPARVLAECAAKRRIVEALDYTPCPCQRADRCVLHDASAGPPEFARERFADPATEAVLHALALPYADRPGYREEWSVS